MNIKRKLISTVVSVGLIVSVNASFAAIIGSIQVTNDTRTVTCKEPAALP